MPKEKNFSYLKIQTVLSPENTKYYERVHDEISEIGKHFFIGDFDLRETNCLRLGVMIKEISAKPYSRERERERERERDLISRECGKFYPGGLAKHFPDPSCEEVKYLNKKIPNSAVLITLLKNCLINDTQYLKNKKLYLEDVNYYKILARSVDPIDLSPFIYETDSQQEYCKKAVEQRQWDHISHLLRLDTGVHSLIRCLDRNNPDHKECNCPEVVELFVKMTPKKYLLDRTALDPSDVELDIAVSANELIKVIKKNTGRDLSKEPKVYY